MKAVNCCFPSCKHIALTIHINSQFLDSALKVKCQGAGNARSVAGVNPHLASHLMSTWWTRQPTKACVAASEMTT